MRSVSSAFFTKMQQQGAQRAYILELETRMATFFWTTANHPVTFTLSGTSQRYEPFPGKSTGGTLDSIDLGVSVIDFVVANTGDIFRSLVTGKGLDFATIKIGEVFTDTPDLGRMEIFQGKIGDYVYNRMEVSGQARNRWNSLENAWPYYSYSDNCVWTFGSSGCGVDVTSYTLAIGSVNLLSNQFNLLLNSGTISASYANGRFDFGRVTITGGINSGAVRTVRVHTGDLLQLSHPLPVNSFASMAISIYPGCRKRLLHDCTSLYDNANAFFGFPWIPIQEQAFYAGN